MSAAICAICGGAFTQGGRFAGKPRYCSKSCTLTAWKASTATGAAYVRSHAAKTAARYRARHPLAPMTCTECGETSVPTSACPKMFCSKRCQHRAKERRDAATSAAARGCAVCGRKIRKYTTTGRCTSCKQPSEPAPCADCGAPLLRKPPSYHRPKRCASCVSVLQERAEGQRRVRKALAAQAREAALAKVCAWCHEPFRATTVRQTFCCDSHNNIAKKTRRERRKRGAPRTLPLPSMGEIYLRDGGVCQLCFGHVDKSCRWPTRGTPSIDHIIPVSAGGPEAADNYQLAHLGCNMARHDKSLDVWFARRREARG